MFRCPTILTRYTLTVRVVGHDGAIIETVTQKIGFRTFRIENGIMTINGKRIVFIIPLNIL